MSDAPVKLDAKELRGFKYFPRLLRLLDRLHGAACQRDRAHNRRLHMDQYLALLLLSMFSPVCDSLQSLRRASLLKKVQQKLGVSGTSMGSLSEAARVFDAGLMESILAELAAQVPALHPPAGLEDLGAVLTAVDATTLRALPRAMQELWIEPDCHQCKAHVHFEVLKSNAVSFTLTGAGGNEKAVLEEHLLAGRMYVLDQGYRKFALLQAIRDAGSSFVARLQTDTSIEIVQERPVDAQARAAGVRRDLLVRLGSHGRKEALRAPVRLVEVECTEYSAKTLASKRHGLKPGDTMWIATDRLDLSAQTVALVYRCRWQIELFFRFLKHTLGCQHLLSHCENGMQLQLYAAIIACLLITLYTGAKPNKATRELLCWYWLGLADEADILAHVASLKKQA